MKSGFMGHFFFTLESEMHSLSQDKNVCENFNIVFIFFFSSGLLEISLVGSQEELKLGEIDFLDSLY